VFLQHISHTIKQNFRLAFSRNWRNSMCLEFITVPVSIRLSKAVSILRHLSLVLYPAPTCMKRPRTESFKFLSHAIHATNDCLTLIDDRGRLIRLCLSSDSMNSSQRCSHARYSSRVFSWEICSCKSRSVCSILPLCHSELPITNRVHPFFVFVCY